MEIKTVHRRFDLDWLRVLAILVVFLFHSTRFFDFADWHVKNPVMYGWAAAIQSFMTIWMMPLIFLISGASIYFAMNKGGAGKFFKDKVFRLLVPLLVVVFTHASLQVYLERITHGQFSGSYFQFLPHYFAGMYTGVGGDGNFAFAGMHMWYVLILFLYSLIFYPLFRWWKGSGRNVLNKIGDILGFPWTMWLALAFPILLLGVVISDTDWESGAGGWGYLYYIFFLLYGFVIVSHERLQANIRRVRWVYLGVGLILASVYVFLVANIANPTIEPFEDAFSDLFYVLSACFLIPAFLGFGIQHLSQDKPFLKHAGEAVLPFYILHQTVLLVIGYFVVQWAIPDLAKWTIIAAGSFVVTIAIYEYIVRRVNVLRILFGMTLLPRTSAMQSKVSPGS